MPIRFAAGLLGAQAVVTRFVPLLLCLAVLATGCSRNRTDLFATSLARLASPNVLAEAPAPALVGDQDAVVVAIHRIESGKSWIVGYREFEGGKRFGPTDQESFVKVTLLFPGSERPSGRYELGDAGVQGYWSTGRVMNGGRTGVYARLRHGRVDLEWLDSERFRLALTFELKAQDVQPPSSDRKPVAFAKTLEGRVKAVDRLSPWEGGGESTSPESGHVEITEVMP